MLSSISIHTIFILLSLALLFFFNSWILAIGHGVEMRCHPFDVYNASDDATIYNVMNISLSHTSPLPEIVIYGRVGG